MTTVSQLSQEMGIKTSTLYELARREEDPLPLRTLKGFKRTSCIAVEEWLSWWERNSDLFKEVSHV